MPFNFYDTHTLLMAVQQLTPAATFLRDRYFPTNDASDIFATDDVLVELRDGSKKLAPVVAPRKGGVTVLRAGYNMERYAPPFVAPRRVLTLDELRKRGFGEALYSQLTPEQRQQTLILRDADELGELITNREEAMAAETMLTNGCVMKHIRRRRQGRRDGDPFLLRGQHPRDLHPDGQVGRNRRQDPEGSGGHDPYADQARPPRF